MQGIDEAENVGYMIPEPVIRHFLEDVSDGRYDGFPRLGIDVQDMESEAQRARRACARRRRAPSSRASTTAGLRTAC